MKKHSWAAVGFAVATLVQGSVHADIGSVHSQARASQPVIEIDSSAAEPWVGQGITQGLVPASSIGSDCSGYIPNAPTARILVDDEMDYFGLAVVAEHDAVVVIRADDGTVTCNDDFIGTQPAIHGRAFEGTFEIWVGTFERGVVTDYELAVGNTNAIVLENVNFEFNVDRFEERGSTTGRVAGTVVGPGVPGFYPNRPQHRITLDQSYEELRFMAISDDGRDLTMIVVAPDGRVFSDDDFITGEDTAPYIAGAFGPGVYTVYVGTYEQGVSDDYHLFVTDHPYADPEHIAFAEGE